MCWSAGNCQSFLALKSTKFNNYLSISVEIEKEIKHNTYAHRIYQIAGQVKPNLNLLPAFKKATRWLLHF